MWCSRSWVRLTTQLSYCNWNFCCSAFAEYLECVSSATFPSWLSVCQSWYSIQGGTWIQNIQEDGTIVQKPWSIGEKLQIWASIIVDTCENKHQYDRWSGALKQVFWLLTHSNLNSWMFNEKFLCLSKDYARSPPIFVKFTLEFAALRQIKVWVGSYDT